jgi:surfeit locus 1 family protein
MSAAPQKSSRAVLKVWLFCAVFLPVTLSLGFWQLDRAEQKRQFLAQSQQQADWPEQLFEQASGITTPKTTDTFRPFRLRGQYLPFYVLLDNRTRDGKVGYEVLTPFAHVDGHVYWVNRGWVQAGRYRTDLPALDAPFSETEISGHFYLPAGTSQAAGVETLADNSVIRVQTLDWPMLSERARQTVGAAPVFNAEFRLRDEDQPGALKTDWPVAAMSPEKHTGYAVQWFGLALALLVLTIGASLKLRRMT